MSLELEIPFETIEGYQYIIGFTQVQAIPKNYGISVINISIVLMSDNIETNSLKTINKFIEIILEYLIENDVIIYFYCDTAPIKMRDNRKEKYSNQEFRFNLFTKMFNKFKTEIFYLQPVVIADNLQGKHYTALISRESNKNKVELVRTDLESFNK